MSSTLRWCSACRAEQEFEVPPCQDGHGVDCPDLACVACGAAVVLAVVPAGVPAAPTTAGLAIRAA